MITSMVCINSRNSLCYQKD